MNKHCFINCLMLALSTIPFIMPPPASASEYPVTPLKSASIIKGQEQVIVSADQSSYNETTGRYDLHGHVRIQSGPRIFLSDSAKISARTLQLWTESPTHLQEGELRFSGGAVYAELAGITVLFSGQAAKWNAPAWPSNPITCPTIGKHTLRRLTGMCFVSGKMNDGLPVIWNLIWKTTKYGKKRKLQQNKQTFCCSFRFSAHYRTIFVKSATRPISRSVALSRPRRFALIFSSLSMTMTPSKKASIGRESSDNASMAPV